MGKMKRRKYQKTEVISAGAATNRYVTGQPVSTFLQNAAPNDSGEMEVLECIKLRRAISLGVGRRFGIRYKTTPIPDEILNKILEAGRWAPSELNSQPVEFVVVKDPTMRHDLLQLTIDTLGSTPDRNQLFLKNIRETYDAPLWVVVVSDREKREITPYSSNAFHALHSDAALAAAVNIALAARAFGIGCTYLTFPDPILAKKMLGIPATMDVATFLPLGYPTAWPDPTWRCPPDGRRPLSDMVHYEKFDEDKWQQYRPKIGDWTTRGSGAANAKDVALEKLLKAYQQ
jgi:nitroreductase